jgi:two-component system sensor histidine kinase UhpB
LRLSLRLGLILAIAVILASTLLVSALLTYRHAIHKIDVEMQSALAAAQRTVRVALQDIEDPGSEDIGGDNRQVSRLLRTFDGNRHVRIELKTSAGDSVLTSKPADMAGSVPAWFINAIAPTESPARIDWPQGRSRGEYILVTADPRNEAAEVWGDSRLHLMTILLFCLLTLSILSILLSYALSPLSRFLSAFERMGRGEVGEMLPMKGPAEFQQLSAGFNRMSGLLAESHEKNRRLDEQLEAVQEEERASLARDLHDDVGPLLFSVDVDATTIRDIADKRGDAAVSERAASIQEAVAHVKEQVRSILWQLRPGVVLDLGLANAIENMLAPLRQRHADVTFRLDMPKRSWRPQIDIALLAIVREAVLNALKHGKPTRIDIRIASDDGRTVEALIRNNGSSLSKENATGRLGVISMQERTHLLGGRLDVINASDGRGVEVRVTIPLDGPGSGPAPSVPSTKTLQ